MIRLKKGKTVNKKYGDALGNVRAMKHKKRPLRTFLGSRREVESETTSSFKSVQDDERFGWKYSPFL